MKGIQFEEEERIGRQSYHKKTSSLTKMLLESGLIKTPRQAQIIFLILTIIFLSITYFMISS